jgi:hypothetical protein
MFTVYLVLFLDFYFKRYKRKASAVQLKADWPMMEVQEKHEQCFKWTCWMNKSWFSSSAGRLVFKVMEVNAMVYILHDFFGRSALSETTG